MAVNQVSMNGEDLINLTADTVTEETLLEGETAHDASGNLITGKFVPYNPNLLINPDFSINQRGQTEYTGGGYTADMWHHSGTGVVTINNGIQLSATTPSVIAQKIENPAQLAGKIVTISAMFSTNASRCILRLRVNGSWTGYEMVTGDVGCVSTTLTLPDDIDTLSFELGTTSEGITNWDISRVKLELGNIQTLARQDDEGNWVIIDPPPNPALELAKCQRYYLPLSQYTRYNHGLINENVIDFNIPIPSPLRALFSVLGGNIADCFEVYADGVVQTGFTFSVTVTAIAANVATIRATKSAHGLFGKSIYMQVKSDNIGLSAEL